MKAKSEASVSMGKEIDAVTLAANPSTQARLAPSLGDVLAAVRAKGHTLAEEASLDDGAFEARDAVFAK